MAGQSRCAEDEWVIERKIQLLIDKDEALAAKRCCCPRLSEVIRPYAYRPVDTDLRK
jgi:hypothetical protein